MITSPRVFSTLSFNLCSGKTNTLCFYPIGTILEGWEIVAQTCTLITLCLSMPADVLNNKHH